MSDSKTANLASDTREATRTLELFAVLPDRFKGREVVVEFVAPQAWHSLCGSTAKALGLKYGASISASLQIAGGRGWTIVAQDELAESLVKTPAKTRVRLKAVTAFGVRYETEYTEDGPRSELFMVKALLAKEVVEIGERSS